MPSLLNTTIRAYICIGVFLYAILFVLKEDVNISWYNVLNLYTFGCYAFLLWGSSNWADCHYSCRNLVITIFVYSVFFLSLNLLLSEYYTDNTFMFSESDARLYEKGSFKLLEIPFSGWIPRMIKKNVEYADWGATFIMSFMLHIIPSKLFINVSYLCLNTISGIFLFKTGRIIMSSRYAYLAALTYSLSSYIFFFMGSFLKEIIMVTWVILSLFFLYLYYQHDRLRYAITGGIVSLVLIFFRPPVAVFIWISYITMFFLKTKNGVFRCIGIGVMLVFFVAAFGMLQDASQKYAHGGDITESYEYKSTSGFQKAVLYAGAFIGPFPQLLQDDGEITYKPLFGAGLLFKLLLFFAFWKGLWYALKNKRMEAIPIYAFVLTEILGLSAALDGLELRKSMPHVPFAILLAFWYISAFDNSIESEETRASDRIQTMRQFSVCIVVVLCAALIWNWR